jgi:hypothetical protein
VLQIKRKEKKKKAAKNFNLFAERSRQSTKKMKRTIRNLWVEARTNAEWQFRVMSVIVIRALFNEPFFLVRCLNSFHAHHRLQHGHETLPA